MVLLVANNIFVCRLNSRNKECELLRMLPNAFTIRFAKRRTLAPRGDELSRSHRNAPQIQHGETDDLAGPCEVSKRHIGGVDECIPRWWKEKRNSWTEQNTNEGDVRCGAARAQPWKDWRCGKVVDDVRIIFNIS